MGRIIETVGAQQKMQMAQSLWYIGKTRIALAGSLLTGRVRVPLQNRALRRRLNLLLLINRKCGTSYQRSTPSPANSNRRRPAEVPQDRSGGWNTPGERNTPSERGRVLQVKVCMGEQ